MTTDVRLTSGLTRTIFLFFYGGSPFFWKKMEKKTEKKIFFSLKTGPLGGSGGTVYAYHTPLVGYTVKTNTTDIQTVDSVYSKTIHQDMEEDHNTKSARDTGVEKHSCQIELRGAHVKLVYYNNKQVLCVYSMLHVTAVPYVRSKDERADTYTYMLR
jgi:hypothetical protein